MTSHVVQVRPVAARFWPRRVRIVGGRRPALWDERLAGRGALVGIPVGAVSGLLGALLVLRLPADGALLFYLVGGAAGAAAGMLLGALLGALRAAVTGLRWSQPVARPHRLWVRHRSDGAVTRRR